MSGHDLADVPQIHDGTVLLRLLQLFDQGVLKSFLIVRRQLTPIDSECDRRVDHAGGRYFPDDGGTVGAICRSETVSGRSGDPGEVEEKVEMSSLG